MSPGDRCTACGTIIPAGTPAGLCGRCLLVLGLQQEQGTADSGVGGQISEARDLGPELRGEKSDVKAQSVAGSVGSGSAASAPKDAAGFVAQTAAALGLGSTVVLPLTEKPGDKIGRYKLLEKIGEGGFGVVYVAEQKEPLKRRVALKIIKLGMDTRHVVARFEAERQALALMDHPNIAQVHDAGATETGRPYFVMELVKGIRITEYCDQKNLTTRERLELFMQVCKAIQHAHQKGIIHRDIKPSNILVTPHDGVPVCKVIDFGIAKATQGEVTDKTVYTQFQQFIGTPAYMSPEQAEISGLDVDTRSDIYSLGVLLYELLVGKTPFDAQELLASGLDEMRRTIREKEPLRPSTRLSSMLGEELTTTAKHRAADAPKLISLLRGDLDWIVMKCLEKDRTRRYETANGLARDVERHLNNEPVVARPPSAAYKLQKAFRRNKLVFSAAVAVVLALVSGLSLAAIGWRQTRVERDKATQAELETKRQLYVSDMALAERALNEGNIHRVEQILDSHMPRTGNPDLRGFEFFYLKRQCQGDEDIVFPASDSPAYAVAYSPDGRFLAAGTAHSEREDHSGQLQVFEVATHKEIFAISHTDGTRSIAFSPDGRFLLLGNAGSVVSLWDWKAKEKRDGFFAGAGATSKVRFSPDGNLIAALFYGPSDGTPGKLVLRDVLTQKEKFVVHLRVENPQFPDLVFGDVEGEPGSIAFSPDGKRLAFVGKVDDFHSVLRFWDSTSGSVVAERSPPWEGTILALAFSPDGNSIVFGGGSGNLSTWQIGEPQFRKLGRHQDAVLSLACSINGHHFVSGSADGTIKLWDLIRGDELRLFKGHRDRINDVVFSPDGSQIASASQDGTIRVWPVVSRETDVLRPGTQAVKALAFSKDGRFLATGSEDRTLKLWDVRTGELRKSFPRQTDGVDSVAISPDGNYLAVGTADGVLKVWEIWTGPEVEVLTNKHPQVASVEFSPDGRFLAAGGRGWVQIWNRALHRSVTNLMGSIGGGDARFSPNGKLLATAGVGLSSIRLWEVDSWRLTGPRMDQDSNSRGLAFTPDGRTLVTGCEDSCARLWDLATGRCEKLNGAVGGAWAVAVSADGKTLAVGDVSGGIKLWSLTTRKELFALRAHEQSITSLAFSPDGTILASASADGTVRLWRAAGPLPTNRRP